MLSLDCSMVVTDLSGELFAKTSHILKKKGFQIRQLNLIEFGQSLKYNPVALANSYTEIQQLAHTIVQAAFPNDKDPFWSMGAERILLILLQTLKNGPLESQNLGSLKRLLNDYGNDGKPIEPIVMKYADEATF